jgi:succinoglycan biosynthesis transport protein ExoP
LKRGIFVERKIAAERQPNPSQSSGNLNLSLGDVYHILFRHKWKIAIIAGIGLIGSLLLPRVYKVPYMSEAKLYIRYVLETSAPTPDSSDPRIKLPDTRGENIINTELEILTSLDLAQQVADAIGPEKILGGNEGNRLKAGATVRKGVTAEVPKNSSVIHLSFQHPNPEIVQVVLQELIDIYQKKHTEIHAVGAFDDFLTQETDQLRSDLTKTEQELSRAKTNLGFYGSPEEAKRFQGEQMARIRQGIFDAEAELAERKAAVSQLSGMSYTNAEITTNKISAPPAEKVAEYRRACGVLESLTQKEREESAIYTPESGRIKTLRRQISENTDLKTGLETENPGLLAMGAMELRHADSGGNPRNELAAETARVSALNSKIAVLNAQLERMQKEVTTVSTAESAITKLQLQREIEEGKYRHFVKGLEQARIDEKLGTGKVSNIRRIQEPSPPFRDGSKIQKARMAVAIGGLALALGLAFVLEMFVDRTIKHAGEIEGKLKLPLFLTVPLIAENERGLNWLRNLRLIGYKNGHGNGNGNGTAESEDSESVRDVANAAEAGYSRLVPYNAQVPLRPFFDGLRDRLIDFFESKNLTHKPKLVAVTGCREGAGVSTFAAGLAASLSETGDGNVLLVDMSEQHGTPKHFVKGRLNYGLDEVLEGETRSAALVQNNLYVVCESGAERAVTGGGGISRMMPKRFTNLMPKLKASDYDYIIFDMPPVGQLSVTPKIARFMDMMLFVIESEKTDRDVAKRAIKILSESNPNLAVVLNKRRSYVPGVLQQEL